ncbi:MAG: PH domain-containing protein [Candidatus Promineifilaceae bacterium]
MNETNYLQPSPRYLTKSIVTILLTAVISLAGAALLSWALSFAPDFGQHGARVLFTVCAIITAVFLLPALILVAPYYRSLKYEIWQDEVIVRAGIITSSVKHVPFRTVTNITIKRGLLDRWFFDLGTLNIQTAGMSGTSGAEESLVGLDDVNGVYDLVVSELHRFRGSMAPTAAGEQPARPQTQPVSSGYAPTLNQILVELQTIRRTVEKS